MLVRTRRDGLCNTSQSTVDCTSGIERFVWAGDNILWEMRGPGANTETADRLELESAVTTIMGIRMLMIMISQNHPVRPEARRGPSNPAKLIHKRLLERVR